MKVVRLSSLRTGRIYPWGNISGIHFCYRLSRHYGHSVRINTLKHFIFQSHKQYCLVGTPYCSIVMCSTCIIIWSTQQKYCRRRRTYYMLHNYSLLEIILYVRFVFKGKKVPLSKICIFRSWFLCLFCQVFSLYFQSSERARCEHETSKSVNRWHQLTCFLWTI
jgi:hypothetical protein